MDWKKWYAKRGGGFVLKRGLHLLQRYGLTPSLAQRRIEDSVRLMQRYGCSPSYPTPGQVVDRYPRFIQKLQSLGAEICVHSYHHIDLRTCPLETALDELDAALKAFERHGIQSSGFRCPYLSWRPELIAALPPQWFEYSSNQAVTLAPFLPAVSEQDSGVFNTINQFYTPASPETMKAVPYHLENLIEIPLFVPDDLQLQDGLKFSQEQIAQFWVETLQRTHRRGELFTLLTHPELADLFAPALERLLQSITDLTPKVWMARLCDISAWWHEKAAFSTQFISEPPGSLTVTFQASSRAAVLIRGIPTPHSHPWYGPDHLLESRSLTLPASTEKRPWLGVHPDFPPQALRWLHERGFITEHSLDPYAYVYYLAPRAAVSAPELESIAAEIESSCSTLIRYGLWPDQARSAFAVTGDLDALSLMDYASRLLS